MVIWGWCVDGYEQKDSAGQKNQEGYGKSCWAMEILKWYWGMYCQMDGFSAGSYEQTKLSPDKAGALDVGPKGRKGRLGRSDE